MEYRVFGRTGIRVSALCFGTLSFGGDADEATSAAMCRACRDAGVNFFDTADQYNQGRSEEILGELARGHRDELVIATKCFNPTEARYGEPWMHEVASKFVACCRSRGHHPVSLALTPEQRAEIAALSRTPPPATDRLEGQKR